MKITKTITPQQGFTLLEVLVAITLTALVLGNLFVLQSQSKRLIFKAQTNLHKNIIQRAYFNAAWINNYQADSYLKELSQDSHYVVQNSSILKKTKEEAKPVNIFLESFEIHNQKSDLVLSSVRLKENEIFRK